MSIATEAVLFIGPVLGTAPLYYFIVWNLDGLLNVFLVQNQLQLISLHEKARLGGYG